MPDITMHISIKAGGIDFNDAAPQMAPGRGEVLPQYGEPPAVRSGILTYDDFFWISPLGKAICTLTHEPWPAVSVNATLPRKQVGKFEIQASQWLAQHRAVSQLTWMPGEPEIIRDRMIIEGGIEPCPGFAAYNLYRAPDLKRGDARKAKPWLRHVYFVYPNDFGHIVRWLAQRVQRPGEKINHSLVLGGAQGVGKDTILKPVIEAVGRWNVRTISPATMTGEFNEFGRAVVLVIQELRNLGDMSRYDYYEQSKIYAAAPPDVLRINEKRLRPYHVPNITGVIQTTNHLTDGMYLPADDRRSYVAWSERGREDFDKRYWEDLHAWLDNEGNGHVAAFLASLDISRFDPKAPPERTPAFWAIVNSNRASEDAEIEDVLDLLAWPEALILDEIRGVAAGSFGEFLRDRRNVKPIVHRLETAGYRVVRNSADKNKGFWKIGARRQPVYAKTALSERERIDATLRLQAKYRS